MHRLAAIAAAALALWSMPAAAWALRPEVAAAVALYDNLRFEEAGEALLSALELDGNERGDLVAIHLHLGILAAMADRPDEAEERFRVAWALEAGLALPPSLPPKVVEPFESAEAHLAGQVIAAEDRTADQLTRSVGGAIQVVVRGDRLALVEGARVRLWATSERTAREYSQSGAGPYEFPVPPRMLVPGQLLRYRVELLGPHGSILDSIGADRPEVVEIVGPGEGGRRSAEDEGPEDRRPLTRSWRLWAVVGAVVAGGVLAVGLGVGLTSQDSGTLGDLHLP